MEIINSIITFVGPYIKELWGILTAFLILGGQWYWNNRKTKAQEKNDQVATDNLEVEKESKEIQNMRDIMNIFQENFKKELLEKNETINNLSNIINELNNKIDKLSKEIKLLNEKMDNNDEFLIKLSKKCVNRTKEDICIVLDHLNSKKIKKD